jgi:hypothetical protein
VRRDIRQKFGDIGLRFDLEAFNGFLPALKLVLDLQVHHDAISAFYPDLQHIFTVCPVSDMRTFLVTAFR